VPPKSQCCAIAGSSKAFASSDSPHNSSTPLRGSGAQQRGASPPVQSGQLRLTQNLWPLAASRPWLENLPPLPKSHGPDSPKWNNSVAICAIMKDENLTDVREWLTYYRCADRIDCILTAWDMLCLCRRAASRECLRGLSRYSSSNSLM
jgi:hypothetical protein